jgi:precorrin-2/cobalt-factor-2 C20-methyltransferase
MIKKLYMVSLGPGDVELLTLKAIHAFQQCDAVCIPTKNSNHSFDKSITYRIVMEAFDLLTIMKPVIPVYAPMQFKSEDWDNQVSTILEGFQTYQSLCYVTLGDASIYSTVYYLLERIAKIDQIIYDNCEVIPGVTSFCAASAKIKKALCLGDETLLIRPINPRGDVHTNEVLMRPKIGMDTNNLGEGDFYTFENLYLSDESIHQGRLATVKKYMTLFLRFPKKEV